MPAARHIALVDKAVDACLAAMEIYNKPDFRYREEAFAILMLNAWELLLKARIIQENNGDHKSIEVWESRTTKQGTESQRQYAKRNRSGNVMTVDIRRAADLVKSFTAKNIDDRCVANLNLLIEIRDNCVHLHLVGAGVGKRIQEVGTAALRNFAKAAETWFGRDLSKYNFYLMPLSFHAPTEALESLVTESRPAAKKLLEFIAQTEREHPSNEDKEFNVTMQVHVRFMRTSGDDAIPVRLSKDAKIEVRMSDADFRARWPWKYQELNKQMSQRYSDFSQNKRYHDTRKGLEANPAYCHERLLDPGQRSSGVKKFYSQAIMAEFDKHYAKK
jgi:hypothetical protein